MTNISDQLEFLLVCVGPFIAFCGHPSASVGIQYGSLDIPTDMCCCNVSSQGKNLAVCRWGSVQRYSSTFKSHRLWRTQPG